MLKSRIYWEASKEVGGAKPPIYTYNLYTKIINKVKYAINSITQIQVI